MAIDWEPTGDLLSDIAGCIEHGNLLHMDYVDLKGNATSRDVAPAEIRDSHFWAWKADTRDIRQFMLANIGSYFVMDENFNRDDYMP